MPTKKTFRSSKILIDEKFFLKIKQASNKEEFHNSLRSLITRANKIYNNVFRSERSKHIDSFPLCKKNYTRIQSIIKNSKFSKNFFKVYHLEAELACIQSDFNALNYNIKSEYNLNLLAENLKKIKLNLDRFNKDFNDLNFIENIDVYEKLLSYRNSFSNSWVENSNRLLGDTNFIYAEYLEKISLQGAINFFTKAINFYKKAGLLMSEHLTIQKINKHKITLKGSPDSSHNKNSAENLPNLAVVLTKLLPSSETPQIQTNKRKKSSNSFFYIPTKKRKENKQIDCKKLLTELKQIAIEIENYTIKDFSNKNELIRHKASLASKYALNRIRKLDFLIKKLSDTEKLFFLKEAQNGFSQSIKFYSQAGLIKKREKTIKCYDILTVVIDSLESKMPASKSPIEKLILSPNQKSRQKPNNGHSLQPIRCTRTLFRKLSYPENDLIQVDNPASCADQSILFKLSLAK